jgi:hypothetical protein
MRRPPEVGPELGLTRMIEGGGISTPKTRNPDAFERASGLDELNDPKQT